MGLGEGAAGAASAGNAVASVGEPSVEAGFIDRWEKESATARESSSVDFAAEVAEKSGAAFPESMSGVGALLCACARHTIPSSKSADANSLFMMFPSEGGPTLSASHLATVNKTGPFVYVLSCPVDIRRASSILFCWLPRTRRERLGFADACQNLVRREEIRERFTDVAPSLTPIYINEKSGVQRDIICFHASMGVDQAVGANHLSAGITEDRELAVYDGLPDLKCVFPIVNTDRHKVRADLVELFRMLRELVQLTGAVGSPVAAEEDQEHALAAHRCKAKSLALLIL